MQKTEKEHSDFRAMMSKTMERAAYPTIEMIDKLEEELQGFKY